jgi:hypothetical protein
MDTITGARALDVIRNSVDLLTDWTPGANDDDDANALLALANLREYGDALGRDAVDQLRSIPEAGAGYAQVSGGVWGLPKVEGRRAKTTADRTDRRWTWDAIGACLGVSKQAARAKYGAR